MCKSLQLLESLNISLLCRRSERWRMYDLMKSVLASRQHLVDAVINGERPKVFTPTPKKPSVSLSPNVKSRYFQELALIKEEIGESSESSEDENYPGNGIILVCYYYFKN